MDSKQPNLHNRIAGFLFKRIESLIEIGLLLTAIGVVFSLFAGVWWFADLWVHFTVQYAVILFAGLLWFLIRKKRKWSLAILPLLVFTAGKVIWLCWLPAPPATAEANGRTLRMVTFNLLSDNTRYDEVRNYLRASDADLIGLLEVSHRWTEELKPLAKDYPYRYFLPRTDNFGIAVMSRNPFEDVMMISSDPSEIPTLDIHFERSRVLLTHPIPPMGALRTIERDHQLADMTNLVSESEKITILTGDFNLTPWSPRFSNLLEKGGLRNAAKGHGIGPTWHVFPTFIGGVTIDHVLHSPEITILNYEVGPDLGSDHRPIIVDFQLPKK